MRRGLAAGLGIFMTLGLGACGGDDKKSSDDKGAKEQPSVLAEAHEACIPDVQSWLVGRGFDDSAKAEEFLTLEDEGESITIQNPPQGGDLSAPGTLVAIQCVLEETGAPASVTSELEQTTALMGRQETDWDGLEMSWSYHPDDGVSAVLTTSS